jgi:hypothetical protein
VLRLTKDEARILSCSDDVTVTPRPPFEVHRHTLVDRPNALGRVAMSLGLSMLPPRLSASLPPGSP